MAQFSGHASMAIGLELIRDRLHGGENVGVVGLRRRRRVEGGVSRLHQPASFGDGEVGGPTITDAGELFGHRAERTAVSQRSRFA